MIDKIINEQNRASHRPCYDRAEKCWRVTFSDRDAEEGDLLYVASEYARTGLYFPYYTMKALGGRGHDHYFEGVLESLLDDPEGFSIQGFEEYYSKQEIEMLEAIQRKLKHEEAPTYALKEIPVTDAMERAFGVRPVKAVLGLDLVCVFETEEQVRSMVPDQVLLTQLEGRIQNATAQGSQTDCVSRSFCPKLSIPEDPVCGSAHCQIAGYWSRVLGKNEIKAYQASRRGGCLDCVMLGNGRIAISGEAALVAVTEIVAELK